MTTFIQSVIHEVQGESSTPMEFLSEQKESRLDLKNSLYEFPILFQLYTF